MAFTNFETKEIHCKVVYFGPSGAGKTQSLRSIYNKTAKEVQSGLLELNDDGMTKFFEFLPVSLGQVEDHHLKLHLFTIPANKMYDSLHSVILKGVDGYIFVADSQIERLAENIDELARVKQLLTAEGYNVADMPKVVQYNKRDLPNVVPTEIMREELNPGAGPEFDSIATDSHGTSEALHAMAKQVLERLSP